MSNTTGSHLFTFPDTIDRRAQETPGRTWVLVPKTSSLKDGYEAITYLQVAKAVNRVSWWLDEELPRTAEYPTVLYQGPNDIRWAFVLFAAQKTGRKHLILNPNNTLEADISLIDETQCSKVLSVPGHEGRLGDWTKHRPNLQHAAFPDLDTWLADSEVKHYPYRCPSTEEEAFTIPYQIIHSSGTTGQPKPIQFTVGYQNLQYRQRQALENNQIESEAYLTRLPNQRILVPFPQTWLAGLAFTVDICIVWECIPVLYPPDAAQPVPLELIADSIRYSNSEAAALIPFYVKQLVKEPRCLDILKAAKLNHIGYAGAPLEKTIIESVEPYVGFVQPMYGCTEVGIMVLLTSGPGDGDYIGFPPETGNTFERLTGSEGDEVHELVLQRSAATQNLLYIFNANPDIDEYRTNDLFVQHPDPAKSKFWRHVGRKDDLVKNHFLTKTHASTVEGMLEQIRFVKGACFGQIENAASQKTSYLIIEVDETTRTQHDDQYLLEMVWPDVEAANEHMTGEIKLTKASVIIAPAEISLPRLGKGTINRREVSQVFEESLSRLG